MDYSTWLSSPMDVSNTSNNTLSLFDDSPVRVDASKVKVEPNVALSSSTTSNEVASNKLWLKDESGALLEELNRVTAENKRLTEMLTVVCENYNDLKRQLVDYVSKSSSNNEANNNNNVNKKRKVENNVTSNGNNNHHGIVVSRNNGESSSSDEEDSYGKHKEETIKAKITRVAVRTEASDSSLILKDGYQWRKYGQKVTRDNPCPRAYFKCSFAPSCPVKKKVQRSLEDQSMLVATYEGEHNHAPPTQQEGGVASSSSNRSFPLGSVQSTVAAPTLVTLDLTKPKSNSSNKVNNSTPVVTATATATATPITTNNNNNNNMFNNISNPLTKISSPEFQKLLSEQMASCLTRDPNFTAALAAAITGRFAKQSSSD